jgi:hypothetical protein
MKDYGSIADGNIELEDYVADPSNLGTNETSDEKPKKTLWSEIMRLGETFFDKAGDKSFTILHKTKDDILKKKYFDDDTESFKLSKGGTHLCYITLLYVIEYILFLLILMYSCIHLAGMFCYSLSDKRFPTAAIVFLHLLLSCIIMGCLGAAVEILIGIIRAGE